ncbi:MAG: hypothetical protein LIP02_03850 [Bacteroidales bacterium]|nr:hypothetical protein [Bacteroidales bacterium]
MLSECDAQGYSLMNYGDFLERLSRHSGMSVPFLLDNQWAVKNYLDQAQLAAAPDWYLERRTLRKTDSVVLYGTREVPPLIRQRPYKKALTLIKFATLALPGLTATELISLGNMIDIWVKTPRYRAHLKAIARWFNHRRRMLDARTKRMAVEILTSEDRQLMTSQLLQLATARGHALAPKSISQLDRILQLLGYAPGEVHSLLHRHASAQPGMAAALSGRNSACASAWADRSSMAPDKECNILDPVTLQAIEAPTEKAQLLLAEVFEEKSPEHSEISEIPETPEISENSENSENPAASLLHALMARSEWTRDEIAPWSAAWPTVDLALEAVNDLAMERVGDTVVEIDGPTIHVTTEYKDYL